MRRNYISVSAIVTIIGGAFIFLSTTYTINLAPEQVTLWENIVETHQGLNGEVFSFDTGEQVIEDSVYAYVKVWSDETVTLNTKVRLIGAEKSEFFNITDNPSEFLIPGEGIWRVQVNGSVVEDRIVDISAGFYYLKPLEPQRITYYPYRYFGYGMAFTGFIASLVIYLYESNNKSMTG